MSLIYCPNCGERISDEADKCIYCGYKLIKIKKCPDCDLDIPEDSAVCPSCGYPFEKINHQNIKDETKIYLPVEKNKKKYGGIIIVLAVFVIAFFSINIITHFIRGKMDHKKEVNDYGNNFISETNSENSFNNNIYFDVVEVGSYNTRTVGNTEIVFKVKGKQNVTVSSTFIAYDSNGIVSGKSSDEIVITEGEYNYFKYSFNLDAVIDTYEIKANLVNDYVSEDERNALKLEKYSQENKSLHLIVKQVSDNIRSCAEFKILFYKDGQIVYSEDGPVYIYAENLDGKGKTDVIKLWVSGIDYDDIEFIFDA